MSKLALLCGFAVVTSCTGRPPVTTASGERIDAVTVEESFATSEDVRETSFRGDRLRTAVDLLEKHGILGLTGSFESKAVHTGKVTLIVKPSGAAERRIVVDTCVHERVCAFFHDAHGRGLVERIPVACKSETPCGT